MKNSITTLTLGIILFLPLLTLAQTYQPLVGIPGVTDNPASSEGFTQYINALYVLAISIAGILAVLKLVIAGAKYMLSDLVSTKQQAIGDIKGALLGLLIILGAVVILLTINRDIVDTEVKIVVPERIDDSPTALRPIVTAVEACEASGSCTVLNCPLLREGSIFDSCESWCKSKGSSATYLRGTGISIFRSNDRCLVPTTTAVIDNNLSCQDLGTADDGTSLGFNCDAAINYCTDTLSGTPEVVGGNSRVNCNS